MKKFKVEITAIVYVLAFALGVYGYMQTNDFDFISCCYNSLRLFILEFDGANQNIPIALNTSRFLSPIILASSIYLLVKQYFIEALLNFRVRMLTNHTIVFSYRKWGLHLIQDRENVLFVTKAIYRGLSIQSKDLNDINDVNIKKAKNIVLLNDDSTNLNYIKEINNRFSNLQNITVYIRLEDNENIRMFNRFQFNTDFKKVMLVNPKQILSRDILLKNPVLDYINHDNKVPHSLVSGNYDDIKWLIFEMANICHYPSLNNLKITLTGNDAELHRIKLINEFPNIDKIVDFYTIVKSNTSICHEELMLSDITSVYIAEETFEDSQINAAHLKRIFHINKNDTNIYVINFRAETNQLYDVKSFNSKFDIKYIFPLHNMFCEGFNMIKHIDEYDMIAESIHNYYKELHGGKDWLDMSENMKMSNRYQAYHTNIKLGYLGYMVDVAHKTDKTSLMYSKSELDILAQMEKRRWNAERLLSGWIYGERNNDLKMHNLLVPWEKLDAKQKQKDRDTVDNITNTITSLGFSITKLDV